MQTESLSVASITSSGDTAFRHRCTIVLGQNRLLTAAKTSIKSFIPRISYYLRWDAVPLVTS